VVSALSPRGAALRRNDHLQCHALHPDSAATTVTANSDADGGSPAGIVKITPKKRGQWIVDASGAHDADSSDIATVAASLTDGDVVTLRPGTYTGSCEITVSARFVGPASGKGIASIRSVDPQHPGLSVSGKKVSLENVSINFEAAGDWPAMWIWRNSIVEMANCSMSTQSKFGILVGEMPRLVPKARISERRGRLLFEIRRRFPRFSQSLHVFGRTLGR